MSKPKSETIILKGKPSRKEDVATAAISPGHLVEFNGAGVRKHATAGGISRKAFALEDDMSGKTISDEYAPGSNVLYAVFSSGDEHLARLAASAAAIVKGDRLESAGNGTLRKHNTGVALCVATESVDNSAGGTEVFITVESL